jgi:sulfonate transport system substrate-binding protein
VRRILAAMSLVLLTVGFGPAQAAPMRAMLAEEKVALIPAGPPFVSDPRLRPIARPPLTSKQAIGPSQFIVLTAREPFIKAHRAAPVDFLEDALRVAHSYMNPKNHTAVEAIFAKLTKQPASHFSWVFTKEDFYCSPHLLPDLNVLQRNVDTTQELGFVKGHLDVRAHSDLSLVREAAARLK